MSSSKPVAQALPSTRVQDGSKLIRPVPLMSDVQAEYNTLNAQLKDNAHQPDVWEKLIVVAERSGDIQKVIDTYDALLVNYPNHYGAQIQYIKHFVDLDSGFERMRSLFQKFLPKSPFVALWRVYLQYIRRLNNHDSNQQRNIADAYEFALDRIGHDKESGDIWLEYIEFVRGQVTNSAWEKEEKVTQIRSLYQRAVQLPVDNLPRLWTDFGLFERGIDEAATKQVMARFASAYERARETHSHLSGHMRVLTSSNLSGFGLPVPRVFNLSERKLVGKWKAYLRWEESDPLELAQKDKTALAARIRSAYCKAVVHMQYYSEIWFMKNIWQTSIGEHDDALMTLKNGLQVNSSSFLLAFAYAEALETRKHTPLVHEVYNALLGVLAKNLDGLREKLMVDTTGGDSLIPSALSGAVGGCDAGRNVFQLSGVDLDRQKVLEFEQHQVEYALVWIVYIRFAFRAEGLQSSRTVFSKARKSQWISWRVFEAVALLEYHRGDGVQVACRVFQKGMEVFGDEVDYILRYLEFLISVNDDKNAHALFEQAMATLTIERARPLWERWGRYLCQYGDLERSLELEERVSVISPVDPPIKQLAQRYVLFGTDTVADRDLGFAAARRDIESGTFKKADSGSHAAVDGCGMGKVCGSSSIPNEGYKRGGSPLARDVPKRARIASPLRNESREGRVGGALSLGGKVDGGFNGSGNLERSSGDDYFRGNDSRDRPNLHDIRRRAGNYGSDSVKSGTQVPAVLLDFIGHLPMPRLYDGPILSVDDLMTTIRTSVIPRSGTHQ